MVRSVSTPVRGAGDSVPAGYLPRATGTGTRVWAANSLYLCVRTEQGFFFLRVFVDVSKNEGTNPTTTESMVSTVVFVSSSGSPSLPSPDETGPDRPGSSRGFDTVFVHGLPVTS